MVVELAEQGISWWRTTAVSAGGTTDSTSSSDGRLLRLDGHWSCRVNG